MASRATSVKIAIEPDHAVADPSSWSMATSRLDIPAAFILLILAIVLSQSLSGAFASEAGGHPDEPAHFVTGLMVRDYLVSHRAASPLSFAEDYYAHYPKVAIGHWPPVFYVIEGAWMTLFGWSRSSLMLLIALITAGMCTYVYMCLRDRLGRLIAAATALALLLLPVVRQYSNMVMADVLLAALMFASAVAYARYLETHRWMYSALFAVFAGLGILTKGNAITLAVLPLAAIIGSERRRFLSSWTFWFPLPVVLVVCGPWYWFT